MVIFTIHHDMIMAGHLTVGGGGGGGGGLVQLGRGKTIFMQGKSGRDGWGREH